MEHGAYQLRALGPTPVACDIPHGAEAAGHRAPRREGTTVPTGPREIRPRSLVRHLADMNLGDSGSLYVFEDAIFMQCY